MSCRNLFIVHAKRKENAHITYKKLSQYMADSDFSIVFEPMGYWDEILALLECSSYYLSVTDSKDAIECDEIFSTVDSFDFALNFPKKEFKTKEYEFLHKKLLFLNDIVDIIFSDNNVESIDFYLSDQYSISLEDFHRIVEVVNGRLAETLIETYEPIKKKDYFGMKTVKCLIKK